MFRVRVPALAVGALGFAFLTASGQELTERDLVKRFLAESPQVREGRARVDAVSAESRGRALWPNPSALYSREGAGLAEFFLFEQPLPISGRLGLLRQAGAAAVSAAQTEARRTIWELATNLRQAFRTLVYATQREGAIRSGLAELDEALRILREREQQGEGSRFDRLRAEREQSEVRTQLALAQANTAEARSRVAAFFPESSEGGTAVDAATGPDIPLPPVQELVARALEARGDYLAEQRHLEQLGFEARAAERLKVPEPVLSAGLKRGETASQTRTGAAVFVTIPLPLFNRGKTELERLRAEGERSQARSQILRQAIAAQVRGAYAMVELRRQVAAEYVLRSAAASSELTRIAGIAYQEGEVGILELLDAYRSAHQTQLRALELKAAIGQAEIELERAVGEPVLSPRVFP